MPIIVAGSLKIKPGSRNDFIEQSCSSVSLARQTETCDDFSVSPDPIDPDRVNIFEKWQSHSALKAFRESGSDGEIFSLILSFDIHEYEVNGL